MKVAYIVSMFPCWSETFVLNELIEHRKAGVELNIYSIKPFAERMVHDEAEPFVALTIYPPKLYDFRLWAQHIKLFLIAPKIYLSVLFELIFLSCQDRMVKLKAIVVFFLSPKFVEAAKKSKIDHLHAHFATYPGILAWIIKSFSGIRFSVTAHAHDLFVNQDLLTLICKNADRIVAISEFNKQFIAEMIENSYERKIEVIHCGINTERFPFVSEKSGFKRGKSILRIISIGRLVEIKGFSYLIGALRLLKEEGFDFKCGIVGDGPLREELRENVVCSGLNGHVDFLGPRRAEEIPELLKDADLFVLACARDRKEGHDGIPVVFMEAMAYGVPVIGTRISGIPELIRHGETGLCAEPENSLSLKEQILDLMAHPLERERMRKEGRRVIENEFNIRDTSRMLREVFQTAGKFRES